MGAAGQHKVAICHLQSGPIINIVQAWLPSLPAILAAFIASKQSPEELKEEDELEEDVHHEEEEGEGTVVNVDRIK